MAMLSALLLCGVWSIAGELFQVVLQRFSELAGSEAAVVRLYLFGAVAHRSCRHPPVCLHPMAGEGRGVNSPSAMPLILIASKFLGCLLS